MKEKVAKELEKLTNLKETDLINLIEIPPSQELGDYSFPCFSLAKQLKKNPNNIASELAAKISSKEFERIEAKGPYLNFFINKKLLAEKALNEILKLREKFGSRKIKEKVLIESPSPNTNKPLHIGHARNIILAQSVKEILKFSGNEALIVNLNNDRGVHICKSLIAYQKYGNNQTPEKLNKKSDHLVGDYYVKFAQELKANPELEKEAQECLVKWEKGDKKTLALWKKMNSWALNGFKETYKKFNLKIDKNYFESKIYKKGKEIVLEEFKKGKVNKKADGAYFVDLSKEGLGEKILLRADGTAIYITQDIYLALLRKKEFNFDKMIYIVASEQNYHFQVLFALLKLFGYDWVNKLYHLNYGLVNLESGRMKSREGTVVDSDDLIQELDSLALEEIEKRYSNLPDKEKKQRAEKIALSALRYYFLKVDKNKEIVFKPEESISFEGNTGPYLLYTYARARSILRKAKYKKSKKSIKIPALNDSEKSLISQLSNFPEMAKEAYLSLSPNLIANYSFQLAQIFNEFYHSNPVIGSENEPFLLSLVDSFSQVLKNSLKLLSIETLEEM